MLMIFGLALAVRALVACLAPGPLQLSDELPGALADQLSQRPWPNLFAGDFQRGPRPALLNLLLRFSFTVFGVSTASAFVLGLLGGAITAAAACGAAWLRFGRRAGLLAGLGLATLPVHVAAGLSLDATALVPMALALAWWTGERAVRGGGRGAVGLALTSGLFLALAPLARYEAVLLVGFVLVAWGAVGREIGWARAASAAVVGALGVLYFPLCGLLSGDVLGFYNEQLTTSALDGSAGRLSLTSSVGLWSGYAALPLGLVGIPLAVVGAGALLRARQGLVVGFGLFVFTGFLVWRSATTSLDPEARYVYVVVSFGTVLLAVGGDVALRWLEERRSRALGLGAGAILMGAVLLGALGTLPLLPGLDGPATEAGRLPVHRPEVRVLIGAVEGLGSTGGLVFADGPTDLPRQELLIHSRLNVQPHRDFLVDLMNPALCSGRSCDAVVLAGSSALLADHPLDPEVDSRLDAAGWTGRTVGSWDLRFPPAEQGRR